MKSIRIVSGGSADTTKVYTADGHEIGGIASIEIKRIGQGDLVEATVTFIGVKLGEPMARSQAELAEAARSEAEKARRNAEKAKELAERITRWAPGQWGEWRG